MIPHIEALVRAAITDPELPALMARGEVLGVPDDLFTRILARVPSYAKGLLSALLVSHEEGNVDIAGDSHFGALRSKAFLGAGRSEADIDVDVAIATATRLLPKPRRWPCATPTKCISIRKGPIMRVRRNEAALHRSPDHGLGGFISCHYGMQVFMRTLNAVPLSAASSPSTH